MHSKWLGSVDQSIGFSGSVEKCSVSRLARAVDMPELRDPVEQNSWLSRARYAQFVYARLALLSL